MRPARKRSVTVILAQRENPLIEISAILTQCDRALRDAGNFPQWQALRCAAMREVAASPATVPIF